MVEIAGCGKRWNRVGVVAPTDWGAATGAVIAATRIVAQPDEFLRWLDEPCALVVAQTTPGRRLGIRLAAFTLVLLDPHGQLLKTLPLSGLSADEVGAWLTDQGFAPNGEGAIPPHPSREALANLDRTLGNVHDAIDHIARLTHGSSPVRTDPETLETTTTIHLSSREGESTRLITVGFSVEGEQGEMFVRAELGDGEPIDLRLPVHEVAAKSDVDAQASTVELFLHKSLERAYASLSREWKPRRPSVS